MLTRYRSVPAYVAATFATLAALFMSGASFLLTTYAVDFLMGRFHDALGIGAGFDLLLLGVPSVMIPVFIATLTVLVQLHHPTSWLTPTLAFGLSCIGLILFVKIAIGFGKTLVADVHQALAMLAMLAAGAITWLVSCWLLRRKTVHKPQSR
jgi:hypothetical protein